jgi:myo-inositol-1(or 4)-monophosphatase
VERHFRPSLAWRLALVGEGRFDAMLTLRDAWDWDIAAAALIAVRGRAPGSPTVRRAAALQHPAARSPGVLAAPAALHAAFCRPRAQPACDRPVPTAGDTR